MHAVSSLSRFDNIIISNSPTPVSTNLDLYFLQINGQIQLKEFNLRDYLGIYPDNTDSTSEADRIEEYLQLRPRIRQEIQNNNQLIERASLYSKISHVATLCLLTLSAFAVIVGTPGDLMIMAAGSLFCYHNYCENFYTKRKTSLDQRWNDSNLNGNALYNHYKNAWNSKRLALLNDVLQYIQNTNSISLSDEDSNYFTNINARFSPRIYPTDNPFVAEEFRTSCTNEEFQQVQSYPNLHSKLKANEEFFKNCFNGVRECTAIITLMKFTDSIFGSNQYSPIYTTCLLISTIAQYIFKYIQTQATNSIAEMNEQMEATVINVENRYIEEQQKSILRLINLHLFAAV